MDGKYLIAGGGLKLMFYGSVLSLCGFLPGVGSILALIGSVMALVGLVKTRRADEGYMKAVWMLAALLVANLVSNSVSQTGAMVLKLAVAFVVLVLGFLQVYFVCTATAKLLSELGQDYEAARGDLVWKLNAVCYALGAAIIVAVTFSSSLGSVLSMVSTLVGLAAQVIYMIFLNRSYHIMGG